MLSLLAPTIFNIEYIIYIYITLNLASKIDQRKENRQTSDYQTFLIKSRIIREQ